MHKINSLPEEFSQNSRLPIRIVSPDFGHLALQNSDTYKLPHRLPYYFFLFIQQGATQYGVDGGTLTLGQHELVFSLPHQIQHMPISLQAKEYYKLGFDDHCLARLPKQYPFLLNPLNQQKIRFSATTARRLQAIFELLQGLLAVLDTDPELILAHLNSLLTEINTAYFSADAKPADQQMTKYIAFQVFVENNLTEHPTIRHAAQELALSTDRLNQLVKHYSGLSPKEFINHRLILEAKRRLHYGGRTSVKELAFELGFSDPSYFSRLFRKITGKTVAAFFQDLSAS
ncbi:helix-turn-helix domain-containing protein [Spirosoma humi]